ncbi:hypothetical protein GQ607_013175, partial [Colletotrichum asianum]
MSLGSLTTIFSPAPACISPDQYWLEERDGQSYVQQGPPFTQAPERFPSGFTPAPASYYWPGLLMDATSVGEYFCPSGSDTEYSGQLWLSTLGCWVGITSAATVAVTKPQPQNSIITTLVLSTGIIGAYAVNVRFEKTNDRLPEETGFLSQHVPTIATTSTISKAQDWDRGSVSAGAAAGIGIGAGIGVIPITAGIFLLVSRVRARRQAPRQQYVDTGDPPIFFTWKTLELKRPELQGNEPMHATIELP